MHTTTFLATSALLATANLVTAVDVQAAANDLSSFAIAHTTELAALTSIAANPEYSSANSAFYAAAVSGSSVPLPAYISAIPTSLQPVASELATKVTANMAGAAGATGAAAGSSGGVPGNSANGTSSPTSPAKPPSPSGTKPANAAGRNGVLVGAGALAVGLAGVMALL